MLEKVQMTHRHESFKWLSSSGMPIYECVEKQDKRGKKQRQNQKSFTSFVEVQVSDSQSIFICKTAAMWIFQEGEHVSPDHLFRVQHKQPYSSDIYCCTNTSTTSTNASTTSTSSISMITTEKTTTKLYESSVPCNLKPDPECALSSKQSKLSECSKNTSGVVDLTSLREEIGGERIIG